MSFPRYEAYKGSGVEWLGEVPEHWGACRLKNISDIVDCKNRTPEYVDHGEFLVVRTSNVKEHKLHLDGAYYTDRKNFEIWTQRGVPPVGSILFTREAPAGEVCIVPNETPLCMGQRMMNIIPDNLYNSHFLFYFFTSDCLTEYIKINSAGSTVTHLRVEQVYNIPVFMPPKHEQSQIARFLDRETDRIDTLIAEQQRLIELLKEKRQAVISHAVTKGLDPTVPMKDSGVEWIGEIPAHWKMMMVKHTARSIYKSFTDGDWIESPYITGEGVRLIQTGNVGIGTYKEKGFRYISEETFRNLKCTEIFPKDVLVCRLDGPVGRACLVPTLDSRMITSVDNAILKPSENFDPRFIVYTMSSNLWLEWIQSICRVGGGFRFRISRLQLGDLTIPAPPVEEQRIIADLLDAQFLKIDRLEEEVEQTITILQERRSALISAAVTGKIDVRDWQAPASASPTYC